eukprot:CAMPEP_0201873454 /NCGR_PEP_ID=MMETSP0902-20130614/5945_1 /ASSEMBLY_ACC=CAM_ASM_000551 /TAXON_ID=420261 /ORGANISM="Thalassiosira antarctica, Strain CCMP982" /LENGTH=144 /DNA_ID=CAMNT_0048400047 /DNA_START=165 /DNA_END=599 /DNA_ORIENTATION=-
MPRVLATSKPDVDGTIDIDHAAYCADHFGECSLEDMDRIRNALHQERVSHVLTSPDGLNNPHGLPEDMDLKFLESDLTFQVDLLRDKLAVEHMQEDSMSAYGNPYSSTMSMPGFVGDLDGESREAAMICLVIAGMVLLPQLLGA